MSLLEESRGRKPRRKPMSADVRGESIGISKPNPTGKTQYAQTLGVIENILENMESSSSRDPIVSELGAVFSEAKKLWRSFYSAVQTEDVNQSSQSMKMDIRRRFTSLCKRLPFLASMIELENSKDSDRKMGVFNAISKWLNHLESKVLTGSSEYKAPTESKLKPKKKNSRFFRKMRISVGKFHRDSMLNKTHMLPVQSDVIEEESRELNQKFCLRVHLVEIQGLDDFKSVDKVFIIIKANGKSEETPHIPIYGESVNVNRWLSFDSGSQIFKITLSVWQHSGSTKSKLGMANIEVVDPFSRLGRAGARKPKGYTTTRTSRAKSAYSFNRKSSKGTRQSRYDSTVSTVSSTVKKRNTGVMKLINLYERISVINPSSSEVQSLTSEERTASRFQSRFPARGKISLINKLGIEGETSDAGIDSPYFWIALGSKKPTYVRLGVDVSAKDMKVSNVSSFPQPDLDTESAEHYVQLNWRSLRLHAYLPSDMRKDHEYTLFPIELRYPINKGLQSALFSIGGDSMPLLSKDYPCEPNRCLELKNQPAYSAAFTTPKSLSSYGIVFFIQIISNSSTLPDRIIVRCENTEVANSPLVWKRWNSSQEYLKTAARALSQFSRGETWWTSYALKRTLISNEASIHILPNKACYNPPKIRVQRFGILQAIERAKVPVGLDPDSTSEKEFDQMEVTATERAKVPVGLDPDSTSEKEFDQMEEDISRSLQILHKDVEVGSCISEWSQSSTTSVAATRESSFISHLDEPILGVRNSNTSNTHTNPSGITGVTGVSSNMIRVRSSKNSETVKRAIVLLKKTPEPEMALLFREEVARALGIDIKQLRARVAVDDNKTKSKGKIPNEKLNIAIGDKANTSQEGIKMPIRPKVKQTRTGSFHRVSKLPYLVHKQANDKSQSEEIAESVKAALETLSKNGYERGKIFRAHPRYGHHVITMKRKGKPFAVHLYDEDKCFSNTSRKKREYEALKLISEHPSLVNMESKIEWRQTVAFIFPLTLYARLSDRLMEKEDGIGESLTLAITCQLCSALSHLHRHGIVHGDLCAQNVLFVAKDEFSPVKLSGLWTVDNDMKETKDLTALGALCFYMLSGKIFRGDWQEVAVSENCKVAVEALLKRSQDFTAEDLANTEWLKPVKRALDMLVGVAEESGDGYVTATDWEKVKENAPADCLKKLDAKRISTGKLGISEVF
ncbi:hypothetical protein AAMO2058_000914100 [Amorphochlora amoebiformis]